MLCFWACTSQGCREHRACVLHSTHMAACKGTCMRLHLHCSTQSIIGQRQAASDRAYPNLSTLEHDVRLKPGALEQHGMTDAMVHQPGAPGWRTMDSVIPCFSRAPGSDCTS